MGQGDGATQRQADTGAWPRREVAASRRHGPIAALEGVEDALPLGVRHARAAVPDRDDHRISPPPCRHLDRIPGAAMLERIVDEVVEQLDHQHGITAQQRQARLQPCLDALAGVALPNAAQHGADHLLDRLPVTLNRDPDRAQPRQLQRVVRQARQLGGLVHDRRCKPLSLGGRQALALVVQSA